MKYEVRLNDTLLPRIDHAWILAQLREHGTAKVKKKLAVKIPSDLRAKDTTPGSALQVRCSPTSKSYVVHARVKGGDDRLRTWPGVGLPKYKDLQAWAATEYAALRSGVDHRAKEKVVMATKAVEQIAVRQALDEYRQTGSGSPKTKGDNIRRVETYMSAWLNRPMLSIKTKMVKDLWGENGEALRAAVCAHQKIAQGNGDGGHFVDGKTQANATVQSFTTIWNHFASTYNDEAVIPQSPVRRAKLKMHEIERKQREWTNDTTRALFKAKVDARTAAFYKILAYAGLRGIELRCLEWHPVPQKLVKGGERGAWVEEDRLVFAALFVKARKAKRGAFYVPLTKELRAIFKTLRELRDSTYQPHPTDEPQWVFPAVGAKTSESGHVESVGWMAQALDEVGVKWTGGTHSTRHWHRDVMRELRYLESEQDAAHNQSTMGMSSVYGARLKPEAHAELMRRVALYIERVVAGKKTPAEGV